MATLLRRTRVLRGMVHRGAAPTATTVAPPLTARVALPYQPSLTRWLCTARTTLSSASSSSQQGSQTQTVKPTEAAAAACEGGTATSGNAAADATASAEEDLTPPPPPVPLFLRMPPIDGVGRCRLQRWCVSEGASFARGDVLAEIDSDLAVIEYKAQTGGVLALRRAKEGDKIVDGQILGVQVLDVHDVPGAAAWLAHVERLARREAAELQKLEAQEEAESDVVDDIERKQGSGGDMEGASAGSKHHHHRNTDSS